MPVNRYKINVTNQKTVVTDLGPNPVVVNPTATTVNIPINLEYQMVDQSEIVEREFVDKEVKESINVIFDYEKIRLTPITPNDNQVDEITYNINLLDSNTFPNVTYYGDIGFVYDDVKFRKNNFTRSFVRLSFYDSDVTTDQRLISFMTLFSRLTIDDIASNNLPNPVSTIPVKFKVSDPIANPDGISEGYYLYNFKDEVTNTLPKELYMRASFNNAKTGKSTNLMTESTPLSIDNLVTKLHTKYILTRDNDGYYYEIDPTYSTNVSYVGNSVVVDLYEVQAL